MFAKFLSWMQLPNKDQVYVERKLYVQNEMNLFFPKSSTGVSTSTMIIHP